MCLHAALHLLMLPQTPPINPARSESRHAGDTRDTHSHDKCCLAHIHALAVRDAHGLLSAVRHARILLQSASLLLLLFVLRKLIQGQKRPDNESQVVLVPEYQSSLSLIGMFSICKNPCCTHPELKHGCFRCMSSGICQECKITSFSKFV